MYKLLSFIFCVLCLGSLTTAQNLVPNPSFEYFRSCDSLDGGIWSHDLPPWDAPTDGNMDGFNVCYTILGNGVPVTGWGYQTPHTGSGFAGGAFYATMNDREYMQVKLDTALADQEHYCISFYVNKANRNNLASNNIGMYISNSHTYIPTWDYLNFTPQINDTNIVSDTVNWTEIYGEYIAHGGERYIIIGNFFPDSLTDTIHYNGGGSIGYAYYFVDDVNVHCCTCDSTTSLHTGVAEIKEDEINIYPNPAKSVLTLVTGHTKPKQINITNTLGQQIITLLNPETIDITDLPNGIYFAEIKTETGIVRRKIIKQ